jgi:hypothetical protein
MTIGVISKTNPKRVSFLSIFLIVSDLQFFQMTAFSDEMLLPSTLLQMYQKNG